MTPPLVSETPRDPRPRCEHLVVYPLDNCPVCLKLLLAQREERIKELESHEPDLIFHDAMHELGANDGETFHNLAYRKAAEIKAQQEEITNLQAEAFDWRMRAEAASLEQKE